MTTTKKIHDVTNDDIKRPPQTLKCTMPTITFTEADFARLIAEPPPPFKEIRVECSFCEKEATHADFQNSTYHCTECYVEQYFTECGDAD